MDNELIKMCDTPEIQDKKRWLENGDIICSATQTMRNKKSDRNVRIVQFHDKEQDLVTSRNMNRSMDSKHRGMVLYIPRIEDVLEWLKSWTMPITIIAGSGNWKISHAIPNQPLKALLINYMHLEHNKTWDGETWAKN
jgi:hypothetical protein